MLKCAAVFSDSMVLQRGKSTAFFGEGEPGKNIEVSIIADNDKEPESKIISGTSATVDGDGKWIAGVPAIDRYMNDLSVTVKCDRECIRFDDVAVGEVFLAGGQSNMEREMGTALDGRAVLRAVEETGSSTGSTTDIDMETVRRVRFYYTRKRSYFDERFYEDEASNAWQKCGSEWMKAWSAVGFFFAYKLAAELGCTVGILGCNWGGTSAACWMGREDLLARESTRIYVDEYDASPDVAGKSEAEQIREYEEYVAFHEEWDRKAGMLYAENPQISWDEVQERLGKCRYPGPMNCGSFLRPYGLYETMIKRVAPYTVRGFIYYQGENDDHRPEAYFDMMQALTACWRREFNNPSAAFILTQLPMHKYSADPDWKNWPLVREAQMKAARSIPQVGAAVIIDQGEFNEIHPLYKRRVGERLALQALWKVYGKIGEEEAGGPAAVGAVRTGEGTAEIEFENCTYLQSIERLYGDCTYDERIRNAESAKETYAAGEIPGFELAGTDGVYYPAGAVICGDDGNRIRVSSEKVGEPAAVRYLWTNYGEVSLYGEVKPCIGEPLPVAPFRIDVGQAVADR